MVCVLTDYNTSIVDCIENISNSEIINYDNSYNNSVIPIIKKSNKYYALYDKALSLKSTFVDKNYYAILPNKMNNIEFIIDSKTNNLKFDRILAVCGICYKDEISTQSEIANRFNWTQSTLANKLRLLNLDQQVLINGFKYGLTERHMRAMLKVPRTYQKEVLIEVLKNNLTVVQTETLIKNKHFIKTYRYSFNTWQTHFIRLADNILIERK